MKTTRKETALKAFSSCGRSSRTKKSLFPQSNRSSVEKNISLSCTAGKCDLIDLEWTDKISECPIYHPSYEEFEDPLSYIQKIAAEASKYGICKIVSPIKPSVSASEVLRDLKFPTYVQPLRITERNMDDKVTFSTGEREYTFNSFKSMADKKFVCRFSCSKHLSPAHLEKHFWLEMTSGEEETVEYAINVDGSAFSSDPDDQLGASKWNLRTLPKLSNSILRLVEHDIPGVTNPMLYIGMLFSMFAWHVEDHYLFSINYHHTGAPKTWYGVPSYAALQFEKVVLDHVYAHHILSINDEDGVFKEIAEKTTMFPPSILLQHSVPVYKAVQMPGEFVVTFPRAYHAGFSNGFSCGEAVNFAIGDWLSFGELASKRYARIGMTAILPCEEILCKEAAHLLKHEDLNRSSAGLASHDSVEVSFVRHMRFFNNAFRQLKNNVKNLNESSTLLPNSHGTIICGTCKRDCYLAFLECNRCFHLLCHFHDIKSLNCPCGGKRNFFIRENIRDMEELAQKLEEHGIMQKIRKETNCSNNVYLQPNAINFRIKSESIRYNKNHHLQKQESVATRTSKSNKEMTAVNGRGKDDNGDSDMIKPNRRGCLGLIGLLPSASGCKKARTSCQIQKTPAKFSKAASEVPSSA